MKIKTTGFSLAVVAAAVAVTTFANAHPTTSKAPTQGRWISATTGFVANPIYDPKGNQGSNPLFESKLRVLMAGATSIVGSHNRAYSVDITIHVESFDGEKWVQQEKIIHRDIAARDAVAACMIDVVSVPEGLAISFNRGPRQTVSLDGTYDSHRISTNFTVGKQTQTQSFGDRLTIQSFAGPDGAPGPFESIALE